MGLSVNYGAVLTPGAIFSTLSKVTVGLGFGRKMSFTKIHAVSLFSPSILSTAPPLSPMRSCVLKLPVLYSALRKTPVTVFQDMIPLV